MLHRVREATRASHEALERRVDLSRRLATLAAYRDVLGDFYGFYAPLEATLAAFEEWKPLGVDWNVRRKTPLLQRDLERLAGHAPPENRRVICTRLPDASTFARALGCAYVMEGSTLGGQLVSRQVKANLNLDADTGCTFFNSYGAHVGTMWRAFCAAMEAGVPADQVDDTVSAAVETFSKLDDWFATRDEARR